MPKGLKAKKTAKARNVKKTQLKQKKAKVQADGDTSMGGADAAVKAPRETAHDLFKRHAAERKKLKAEVAELKRQRMKMPKKGKKDAKKVLSQKIQTLEQEMRERHQAEQKAAGLEKASQAFVGNGSDNEDGGPAGDDSDDESM
mmetsp:Transcript_30177/g.76338  ORF Transcript_30177/g.76338 Transcript_30177/m.76338 type:complete len:144 (-) Transcript_30177:82-513(-)|eukprot:CAMPEP_0115482114 /NCGR_PEP_ID=MMETSP0271-20121206/58158_1 /TAXON_ID=71861 /ORGANISM="Scrippsiella trochoidea, Strain CCMP3099" /LENGTH=143 /DNA_ID=CAMNT_0002909893 /DNA_START=77 /DNA_END=508 /DNA_ORIENTATION=-